MKKTILFIIMLFLLFLWIGVANAKGVSSLSPQTTINALNFINTFNTIMLENKQLNDVPVIFAGLTGLTKEEASVFKESSIRLVRMAKKLDLDPGRIFVFCSNNDRTLGGSASQHRFIEVNRGSIRGNLADAIAVTMSHEIAHHLLLHRTFSPISLRNNLNAFHEIEINADKLSVMLMILAGFPPETIIKEMDKTVIHNSRLGEKTLTHPDAQTRKNEMRKYMREVEKLSAGDLLKEAKGFISEKAYVDMTVLKVSNNLFLFKEKPEEMLSSRKAFRMLIQKNFWRAKSLISKKTVKNNTFIDQAI